MKAAAEDVVEIRDLQFAYNANEVFRGLSLAVPRGQVVAMLDALYRLLYRTYASPHELRLRPQNAVLSLVSRRPRDLTLSQSVPHYDSSRPYYLAMTLDGLEQRDSATIEFLRCRELDLATPRAHWALSVSQFERRVRAAIEQLEPALRAVLDGALIVVVDVPGAEVVAEGVDPRAAVLLDARSSSESEARAGRAFVYQRNVERLCEEASMLEEELLEVLKAEIGATFPALAPPMPAPTTPAGGGDACH